MSTTTAAPARSYASYSSSSFKRLFLTREAGVIAALVIVIIAAMAMVPNFANGLTTTYLLREAAPILFIALPMTMVIITEEIDLSVASVVGLASASVGLLAQAGLPFGLVIVIALVIGAACGALNGFLVTVVGLPSLAVTIGTLALYRGIAVGLLGTEAVTGFPESYTDLAKANIPGTMIPAIMIPFIILAIVFALVLHFTPFGRGLFAIGLSKEAAAFSGVNVARSKFTTFVLSGLVSSFAGIYFTLLYSNARGDNANGMELQVIAAVLLGGVSIFGGRGALHGVIGGVLLIGVLGSALRLAGITSDIITVITGVLLIASVVSAAVLPRIKAARRSRT